MSKAHAYIETNMHLHLLVVIFAFLWSRYQSQSKTADLVHVIYKIRKLSGKISWTKMSVFLIRRSREIAKSDYGLHHVCLSLCLSIHPFAWTNSAPTGQIFTRFDIGVYLEYLSRKFKFP